MDLQSAIALQPAGVQFWVMWLTVAALGGAVLLMVWRESRVAGLSLLAASVAAGLTMEWLFALQGYSKLLGTAHIPFWTPWVVYAVLLLRAGNQRMAPRVLLSLILVTLVISLIFDYANMGLYVVDRVVT